MKTTHTPGPWHVDQTPTVKTTIHACRGFVAEVSKGTMNEVSADEMEANANLIAASPDLIAALQEVLRVLVTPRGLPDKDKGRTPEQQTALNQARAAIAKATGGEV